ncbi:MAG: hypothetical protein ACK5W9_04250 [Bdellovibrionales bacterium]
MAKKYEYEIHEGFITTKEDLKRAEVKVKNGRLYSPFYKRYVDTGSYRPSSHSDEILYNTTDFVITADGKILLMLFLEKELRVRLYHSDLSHGKEVVSAGTIAIADGIVVEITNHSGHYGHGMTALNRGIKYLNLLGLKISKDSIYDYTGQLR